MRSRRPLILITLCRRYHELSLCLERIWQAHAAGEFDEPPEIWVVWARPELPRLWYLQELKQEGRITRLLTRVAADEQDGQATTLPESRNLRLGLEAIRDAYGDAVYVIAMTADIQPRPGVFRHLHNLVNVEGHEAVVFHWQNGTLPFGVWHTNFFVVPTREEYWPPVAQERLIQDVLERQWGLKLEEVKPAGVCKTNNCGCKFFTHHHLSESLPAWPCKPQHYQGSCGLIICGSKHWWRRFIDWCISLSTAFKIIRREHG